MTEVRLREGAPKRRGKKNYRRSIGLALSIGLGLAGLMALPIAALSNQAPGQTAAFVTPGDMKSGALLLQSTEDGRYVEAPKVNTDVSIVVTGPVIRARVTQAFRNPSKGWVEGIYVYPLSEGSAVDSMKMVIGERVVVADIKEKQEAKVIYEEAKAAGQKAALMEQERPNLFTNSVANIGPGETVVVQIEYQETVRQSGNEFSLRVPLVAAPRYSPAAPLAQTVDIKPGGGWGTASTVTQDPGPTPPVLDPAKNAPVNPVTISVSLHPGFSLGEVKSHHHKINEESFETQGDAERRIIRLASDEVPADRDFELTWKPVESQMPSVGLFRETVGGKDYALAFVTPPTLTPSAPPKPREIVFVIDNSGSMGGTSMAQAKASLDYALSRLKPVDRFNVIRFDNTMEEVFTDTVPADKENVDKARAFVSSLEASGGTEMLPALKAALTDKTPDPNYLRQIVFLTDGAVSNEDQMFSAITSMLGRSRLFMVGIGSAPNSHLMSHSAQLGRGTYTYIGEVEQVETRMRGLFDKLEAPAVTNLAATFSISGADVTPEILPDIYSTEPLVIAAKLANPKGTLTITGTIGDKPWSVTLPMEKAEPHDGLGLSKVWARRKITDLEVARTLDFSKADEADKAILKMALEHHLVTRLTSLVAVDKTPSRPKGARLTQKDVPLNLPAGWDFEKVFGPQGETPEDQQPEQRDAARAKQQMAQADLKAGGILASPAPQKPSVVKTVNLPKGGTDALLKMAAGLAILTLGLVLLGLGRRRALP